MIAGYKTLKAGDVRKVGDECHRTTPRDPIHSHYGLSKTRGLTADLEPWAPTNLIGHVILQSDLMGFEYRRPLL